MIEYPCSDDAFLDGHDKPQVSMRGDRFQPQRLVQNIGIGINERRHATQKRASLILNKAKSGIGFARHGHSDTIPNERNGRFSTLRPTLFTNGERGDTQGPDTGSGHSVDLLMQTLESRRQMALNRTSNSFPKEKTPPAECGTCQNVHNSDVTDNDMPPCNSKAGTISEIPTFPTIEPDRLGKLKRRGSTGYMSSRPSSTSLNSDCFTERSWSALDDGSALDDELPKVLKRSCSKTVLSALGVSNSRHPLLDMSEELDSSKFRRAADLFPAPTTLSNPYEEDREFIDGLVFFAPKEEDAILSMMGHPTEFMSPLAGQRRAQRRQSV